MAVTFIQILLDKLLAVVPNASLESVAKQVTYKDQFYIGLVHKKVRFLEKKLKSTVLKFYLKKINIINYKLTLRVDNNSPLFR